jgi:hypothetical protein
MTTTNLRFERLNYQQFGTIDEADFNSLPPPQSVYLRQTEARMLALEQFHAISQEYILQIPYFCQIYHLLNLKHLELVHCLSLKSLKIHNISQFESTQFGGSLKFQTRLESSANILRLWRPPVVDVELTLHNPYTIELTIGIYKDRKIVVLFNVVPLGDAAHRFFIDIYTDLAIPKPILKLFLHCASCITLLEDLPYLYKLANKNFRRLVKSAKVSDCQTMQLFNRFVELYEAMI